MSQPQSSPAISLQDPSQEPQEVVTNLWGCDLPEHVVDFSITPFYEYDANIHLSDDQLLTCGFNSAYLFNLRHQQPGVAFAEIKKAIVYIHAQSDNTLPRLVSEFPRDILPSQVDDEKMIEDFIRFCIRIWLRVDFEAQFSPNKVGLVGKKYWPKDRTLKDAIAHLFPKTSLFAHAAYAAACLEESGLATGPLQAQFPIIPFVPICSTADWEDARWKPGNTIPRFVSWGYFAVNWTSRLQDHLLVEEHKEPPLIHFFAFASFLENSKAARELFPEGLILETLCSMELLLPRKGPAEKWFEKEVPRSKHHRSLTTVDSGMDK